MFDSKTKCPNCRGTTLIRTEKAGEYQRGECYNCRWDRSDELPQEVKTSYSCPPLSVDDLNQIASGGVTALSGGWYMLPDGSKVHGKAALEAAIKGGGE